MVTELVTGLGMLGYRSVDEGLAARPAAMADVAPGAWDQLESLRTGGFYDPEFEAAFANGAAFLSSPDALRHRVPLVVEWKGSQRAPGDEVAPIDLRVDHVYLVSCKYLSRILINASPAHLFEQSLAGPHGRRNADWYGEVAPGPYDRLYQLVRRSLSAAGRLDGVLRLDGAELPTSPVHLRPEDRRRLSRALAAGWPDEADGAYRELAAAVAAESAQRWEKALATRDDREAMFWRLLRMGSAPYFVLGSAAGAGPLRLRIATPWDWRQRFQLDTFDIAPQAAGQPRVRWTAAVKDRLFGGSPTVSGHVEVRWSHGRFGGLPEAKCYLDSPFTGVPGYFDLST
jgi:hypothetical protein